MAQLLEEENRLLAPFIRPGQQASGGYCIAPGGGAACPPSMVWSSSMGMAPSGESHSIFVVQQTFARVRRGYDPDQVDRHLELVAEMFRRGPDVELRRELARREATIEQEIEAARMEAEATVEGARLRAAADLATPSQPWRRRARRLRGSSPRPGRRGPRC